MMSKYTRGSRLSRYEYNALHAPITKIESDTLVKMAYGKTAQLQTFQREAIENIYREKCTFVKVGTGIKRRMIWTTAAMRKNAMVVIITENPYLDDKEV